MGTINQQIRISSLERQIKQLTKENEELKRDKTGLLLELSVLQDTKEKLENDQKLVQEQLKQLDQSILEINACKEKYREALADINEVRKEYKKATREAVKEIKKITPQF